MYVGVAHGAIFDLEDRNTGEVHLEGDERTQLFTRQHGNKGNSGAGLLPAS